MMPKSLSPEEMQFWQTVFLKAMEPGQWPARVTDAAEYADAAVNARRQRFSRDPGMLGDG